MKGVLSILEIHIGANKDIIVNVIELDFVNHKINVLSIINQIRELVFAFKDTIWNLDTSQRVKSK